MDDLITWLRAQLDLDKRLLEDASDDRLGRMSRGGKTIVADAGVLQEFTRARLLREVEAKRLLLDEHHDDNGRCEVCADPPQYDATWQPYPCRTVRLLALPFSDRPGYQESWRP